jgi:acyl-CoA thioester hydrolase
MSGPFTAYRAPVRAEWVDYNGHLNDSAYAVVCAQANELLLDALGVGAAYRAATGCSTYTVEAHLRFLAEVGAGAELHAESVLVAADGKRLRVHTTLLDAADTPVLTGEYLYLHVDGAAGRVVPFPPDRAAAVAAMLAEHAAVPRPAHLGSGITTPALGFAAG